MEKWAFSGLFPIQIIFNQKAHNVSKASELPGLYKQITNSIESPHVSPSRKGVRYLGKNIIGLPICQNWIAIAHRHKWSGSIFQKMGWFEFFPTFFCHELTCTPTYLPYDSHWPPISKKASKTSQHFQFRYQISVIQTWACWWISKIKFMNFRIQTLFVFGTAWKSLNDNLIVIICSHVYNYFRAWNFISDLKKQITTFSSTVFEKA